MNRVPFGKESKLEIFAVNCPGCNASRGQYHEYGCPVESCPKCYGRLLKCSCMALSLHDEFKLAEAVAQSLTREQVLEMSQGSETLDRNYKERGAFSWIIKNSPPVLKKEMEAMAQEILGAKRHGDHFLVPEDKAAEALGMSLEEAKPIMEKFEADALYPDWEVSQGSEH